MDEQALKVLTDGTVEAMEAKLPFLRGADLQALHDAEKAGKNRSTALDAIHRRMQEDAATVVEAGDGARDFADPATEDAKDLDDTGGDDGVSDDAGETGAPAPIGSDGEREAASPETPERTADPAELTGVVITGNRVADVDGRDAVQDSPLLNLPKRRTLGKHVIEALEDGDEFRIAFADIDGEVQPVPMPIATKRDFQIVGGQNPHLIYQHMVEIGMALPKCVVRRAFLIDEDDDVVAECRLSADLNGGAGRKAQIPDGNLLFALAV